LTFIYYPNVDWCLENGGELCVYLADGSKKTFAPIADRLVIFQVFIVLLVEYLLSIILSTISQSRLLEHEVMECHQPRFAISCWFCE
jgi:Rps23 Pro-64 3,4-dihydroxylase Tpa1-like proline 4-hydroxylase